MSTIADRRLTASSSCSDSSSSSKRNPPPPAKQKEIIKAILKEEAFLRVTSTYHIINHKWYFKWKEYVQFDEEKEITEEIKDLEPPGQIDNLAILKDTSYKSKGSEPALKPKLVEGVDYSVLPRQLWAQLHRWSPPPPKQTFPAANSLI